MAKPILPVPAIFAADLNYTTGPAILIGTATKIPRSAAQIAEGWTGTETPPAQEYNDLWHQYSTWAKWVAEGRNTADLTDFIVETDSTGEMRIARAEFGGTAHPNIIAAVSITANSISGKGLLVIGDTSGAIEAQGTNAQPVVTSSNAGSGACFFAVPTDLTAPGFQSSFPLALSTNNGAELIGGKTNGSALVADSQSIDAAIIARGNPAAASSDCLWAVCQNDDSVGVRSETTVNANAGSYAVHARGRNKASAILAIAADATALVVQSATVSPAAAPLNIVPQDDDPTTPAEGDIFYNSTEDQLKAYINGLHQGLWATKGGFTQGYNRDDTLDSQTGTAWKTTLTTTTNAPYEPKKAEYVEIRVEFEFSKPIIGSGAFTWRVWDATAGAAAVAARVENANNASANGDDKYVTQTFRYLVPAVGNRTYELQFADTTAGQTSHIRNKCMTIKGMLPPN